MTKVWAWLKKYWYIVVGALLAIAGIGGAAAVYEQKRKVGKLKDELAVAEATKEIEKLRAVRAQIAGQVTFKDEAIEGLDRQILDNQRKIIEAHEDSADLTDEEMLAEFDRLGY